MDYRDAIAQSILENRRRAAHGMRMPTLAPLGTGAPVMQQPRMIGTPPQRPAQAAAGNPLLAGYRAAAGPADEDAREWGTALRALRDKWNAPKPSDLEHEYLYGDREMGPR